MILEEMTRFYTVGIYFTLVYLLNNYEKTK